MANDMHAVDDQADRFCVVRCKRWSHATTADSMRWKSTMGEATDLSFVPGRRVRGEVPCVYASNIAGWI